MDPAHAHERNNFDALRILAALMVVFGHAYILSGRGAAEPLAAFTGIGGFGELGVSIFFVVSGFLVTMSHQRLGDVRAFMVNRGLRILPGLAAAVVLTALVLGPLVSTLAPADYFSRPQTWLYPLRNVLLYPVDYLLPGVFAHNPYPDAVNGSLWTLRLEFSFYLTIPLLAWCGLLTRTGLRAVAAAAAAAYLAVVALGPAHAPVMALIATRNFYLFAAGAALFMWRGHPALRSPGVLSLAGLLFVAALPFKPVTAYVAPIVLPLVVAGLALRPVRGVSAAARFGDLSYGVYIYAFPVQQAWMALLGPQRLDVAGFLGVTLACVLPLAALSWWLVERPALGLKAVVHARLAQNKAPRLLPAEQAELS
ncbi:MAG TPA: acyltransferase [Caulobacteraceae bacterium]|jgi:peptidoglycan/LPS O-acetylase OafA/YrhL|nr:acyltransferase [Caulobacteraceae bacterium]